MPDQGKAIALFSDGTGNTVLKGRGTNVFKMYEAVHLETAGSTGSGTRKRADGLRPQVAFYDDGVGTDANKFLKLLGGAFGWGLKRNVLELYSQLCRAYRPGDDVYLFGFSRGAYTVRLLAGLVVECGIVRDAAQMTDADLGRLTRAAYRAMRSRFQTPIRCAVAGGVRRARARWRAWLKRPELPEPAAKTEIFRKAHSFEERQIRFLGVWDTVAAVGFPVDFVADLWHLLVYPFKFPNRKLAPEVAKACQALAIDDERHTFHPVLWDEKGEPEGRIEQVWFAGAHSNVGGGYPKQGLSLIVLDWMIARAEAAGLRFVQHQRALFRELQNPHDKLYDSRSGLAAYYRFKPRDIACLCAESGVAVPQIHASVLERIALGTQGYAPGNLPNRFEVAWTGPRAGTLSPGAAALARRGAAGLQAAKSAEPQPLLLGDVRGWVRLRRGLHYGLLGGTLCALVLSALARGQVKTPPAWVPDGLEKVLRWTGDLVPVVSKGSVYDSLFAPALAHPDFGLSFLGGLIFVYLAGKGARRRCQRVFETFWRRAAVPPPAGPKASSKRRPRRPTPPPPAATPQAAPAV